MITTQSRTPAEALADNVRVYRTQRRFSQAELAERMNKLVAEDWHQQTVSMVEAGRRSVDTNELVALAGVLGVNVGALLDPAGPDRSSPMRGSFGGLEFSTNDAGGVDVTVFTNLAAKGRESNDDSDERPR